MSERTQRTLVGTAFGLVLLILLMLAVTAGATWVAYAVPVALVVTLAWAFDYGMFGKRWFLFVCGALAAITVLVALIE